MILQAFLEDSSAGDFYTVAGYVAPIGEWYEFCPKWHSILKERPRLGFYRTFDAVSLSPKGQFAGWSEANRDDRIARLAATIPANNSCGVSASLSKRDFEEFFMPNFPDWQEPYYVCAMYLIQKTCYMLHLGNNHISKLDFVFDRQGSVGGKFRIAYEAMLRPMSLSLFPFMGDVDHKNKAEFLPLQAADMYAAWVRRSNSTNQMWTAADRHLSRIEGANFNVTRGFLEKLAKYRIEHAEEIKAYFDKVAPERSK